MHFAFTDEQAMIAETVRGFFAENATSERTRIAMAGAGIDRALWASFCTELGLSGVAIPEDSGGAGLGLVELAIVAEAAGAQVAAVPLLGHVMGTQALAAGGGDRQLLGELIAGAKLAAYAHSIDLKFEGDTLDGAIEFIAHGSVANCFVISTNDEAWLVAADTPGVTVTPLTTMDQTRPYARLALNGVSGEPLANPAAAISAAHNAGFVVLAAEALGGAQACLD